MRRYAKKDHNQNEIACALRACGATVFDASSVGNGFPDLVVFFRRQVILFEVKNGNLPPSARQLTPAEVEFHGQWEGGPIYVVSSVDEAITVLNDIA